MTDLKRQSQQVAFYSSSGMELVAPSNYPRAVRNYLAGERAVVRRACEASLYDLVVEAGCMDGRLHRNTIHESGIRYLGLDVVPELIERLLRNIADCGAENATARVLDICDLHLTPEIEGGSPLVVFPFNSFGNLVSPNAALASVARCDSDILILTYRTDDRTNGVRTDYYRRCGYSGLTQRRTPDGVLFSAQQGLHSMAYERSWLLPRLNRLGFEVTCEAFADIGVCYWGRQPMKNNDCLGRTGL